MFPVLLSLGSVQINSSLITTILALLLGIFVFWKRGREEYFSETEVVDLVFVSLFWALVAGRLIYILANLEDFGVNVYFWVALWLFPGLSWQGMLVGGLLGFWRFCSHHRWNLYKALDLAVIGLSLSHFWMNFGSFLAGSVVGKETSFFLGMVFAGTFERRHPVGLYAAVMWLILFIYLWWVEGKYRRFVWYQRSKGDARPGYLFFVYLTGLGFIGFVAKLFSEIGTVVYGVDLNVLSRLLVFVIGLGGLYLRSGLSVKSGVDEAVTALVTNWENRGKTRKKIKRERFYGRQRKSA